MYILHFAFWFQQLMDHIKDLACNWNRNLSVNLFHNRTWKYLVLEMAHIHPLTWCGSQVMWVQKGMCFMQTIAHNPPFHPSIHSSIHLFIHLFIHSFIHPLIYPFIHPPIHSYTDSSIYPFIQPFTHPFIHPSIHSSTHSSIPST